MDLSVPIIGIVRHSINVDGEGVCTLVAFHTCTLQCQYCLNPQSLTHPEIFESYTPQQLYDKVKLDELYFLATNGGVTFGGGEPCLRTDFIKEFRKICGDEWKISVETSLNVPIRNIETIAHVIDNFIVDIKDINPEIYRKYTGKNNNQVIENLKFLQKHELAENVTIRIPLIPDYNTENDCENSEKILSEMGFSKFNRFTYRTDMKQN